MPEQFRRDENGNWERDTRSDSYIPANPRFLMLKPAALRQMGRIARLQLALYRTLGTFGFGLFALITPYGFTPFFGLPFSTHAVLTALLALLIAGTSGLHAAAPAPLFTMALYCFAAGSLVLAYAVRSRRVAALALSRNVLLGLLLFYVLRAAIEMLEIGRAHV